MDQHPTTDEAQRQAADPLDKPEVKSGVLLPQKTSQLRRKLGHKAKQEPRFRLRMRMWRHLRRRSQRPYRPPANENLCAHLQRLGLQFPTDLERPAHASR